MSLKWTTEEKRKRFLALLSEYSRLVNCFIDLLWDNPVVPDNSMLLAAFLHTVPSNLSNRMVREAAREAVTLIRTIKCKKSVEQTDGIHSVLQKRPTHRGTRMVLSCNCCDLQPGKNSFDLWLRIFCIGNRQELWLPTRRTKQYLKWKARGAEATTLIITPDFVTVAFEIQTGPKVDQTEALGVDTGITALATCSDGSTEGTNIKSILEAMDRKKRNSKAWQREKRHLKHVIATTARTVVAKAPVIVVEKLKGITHKTKSPKRRLGLKMRRWIGQWNVMYWLSRIQAVCEENRVSFRTVPAYNTSVICSDCGFSNPGNRPSQAVFSCLKCGFKANADFNASINIASRYTSGPYGAGCKVKLASSLVN
jgi:hypothetical protein